MGAYFYTWFSYDLKISIYEVSRIMDSLQDQSRSLEAVAFKNCCSLNVLMVERGVVVACWGKNVASLYTNQV